MWRLQEIKLFERPGNKWEDNIKIDLKEIGWEDVEWTRLTHDGYQYQSTVLNIRLP